MLAINNKDNFCKHQEAFPAAVAEVIWELEHPRIKSQIPIIWDYSILEVTIRPKCKQAAALSST